MNDPSQFKFGDLIENGSASDDNPIKLGFFVRHGERSGRLNPGKFVELTNGKGKFWTHSAVGDHNLRVVRKSPL